MAKFDVYNLIVLSSWAMNKTLNWFVYVNGFPLTNSLWAAQTADFGFYVIQSTYSLVKFKTSDGTTLQSFSYTNLSINSIDIPFNGDTVLLGGGYNDTAEWLVLNASDLSIL